MQPFNLNTPEAQAAKEAFRALAEARRQAAKLASRK
jgi:hypothetical protein